MGRKISVTTLFVCVLVCFVFLSSVQSEELCERCLAREHDLSGEIQSIDKALEELRYQLLLHRARALWSADKGMRLQNKKGFYLEARRAYKEAEFEWEVAEMIDKRMGVLRMKRSSLGEQKG